ncbi:MAG: hypothetical protein AB1540_14390 [Bdellovibrionota bacterium]
MKKRNTKWKIRVRSLVGVFSLLIPVLCFSSSDTSLGGRDSLTELSMYDEMEAAKHALKRIKDFHVDSPEFREAIEVLIRIDASPELLKKITPEGHVQFNDWIEIKAKQSSNPELKELCAIAMANLFVAREANHPPWDLTRSSKSLRAFSEAGDSIIRIWEDVGRRLGLPPAPILRYGRPIGPDNKEEPKTRLLILLLANDDLAIRWILENGMVSTHEVNEALYVISMTNPKRLSLQTLERLNQFLDTNAAFFKSDPTDYWGRKRTAAYYEKARKNLSYALPSIRSCEWYFTKKQSG